MAVKTILTDFLLLTSMVHYSSCSALGFDEGFGSGFAFVDQLFELSLRVGYRRVRDLV
jgi:hypothetical protein